MYDEQIHAIEAMMTPLNDKTYTPLAFAKVIHLNGERHIEVVTRAGMPIYLKVGDNFNLTVKFTEDGLGPYLVKDEKIETDPAH